MKQPNFELLLNQGEKTYESEVGIWWIQQAKDKVHLEAYRNISDKIFKFFTKNGLKKPRIIGDYACGTGALLHSLEQKFPKSQLLGIDGSQQLLDCFANNHSLCKSISHHFEKQDLTEKFHLMQSHLPNFSITKNKLDLIVWCFPNLIASEEFTFEYNDNGYQNEDNIYMAEMLSRFREMDPEDEVYNQSKDDIFDELLSQRVIHFNLCSLLKPGGIYVKIEYANGKRKDMSDLNNMRSDFCEGTLHKKVKGHRVPPFFKFLKSTFFESEVILDVFAQTGDPGDKEGGYTISFFEKI